MEDCFRRSLCLLGLCRLYGGDAQLPCLLLVDDFAATIACAALWLHGALAGPAESAVLDGLTSYPLPCLALPVRWGSDGP